jgi:hypothetical protein
MPFVTKQKAQEHRPRAYRLGQRSPTSGGRQGERGAWFAYDGCSVQSLIQTHGRCPCPVQEQQWNPKGTAVRATIGDAMLE